jgi:WD repeat-containing protein 19
VPILTSAVIECTRASFKSQAIEYAAVLMKSENKELIDPKLRKKIENLVRKSAGVKRSAAAEEEEVASSSFSPCPFCEEEVSVMEVSCMVCKNEIPFCIATGHHISRHDITFCPHCDFPALLQPLERLLAAEPTCPMCSSEIPPDSLTPASNHDVELYLTNSKHGD